MKLRWTQNSIEANVFNIYDGKDMIGWLTLSEGETKWSSYRDRFDVNLDELMEVARRIRNAEADAKRRES